MENPNNEYLQKMCNSQFGIHITNHMRSLNNAPMIAYHDDGDLLDIRPEALEKSLETFLYNSTIEQMEGSLEALACIIDRIDPFQDRLPMEYCEILSNPEFSSRLIQIAVNIHPQLMVDFLNWMKFLVNVPNICNLFKENEFISFLVRVSSTITEFTASDIALSYFKLLRKLIRLENAYIDLFLDNGLLFIWPVATVFANSPQIAIQYLKYISLCVNISKNLIPKCTDQLIDSIFTDLKSVYGNDTEMNILIFGFFFLFTVDDKMSLILIRNEIHLFVLEILQSVPLASEPEAFAVLAACASNSIEDVSLLISSRVDYPYIAILITRVRTLVFRFICSLLQVLFNKVPHSATYTLEIAQAIDQRIPSMTKPEKDACALTTTTVFQSYCQEESKKQWLLPNICQNFVDYVTSLKDEESETFKHIIALIWELSQDNEQIREILISLSEFDLLTIENQDNQ